MGGPPLSRVFERFEPSLISEIFSLAVRLKEDGRALFDFSTGEPDFDTPGHIKAAAVAAMALGETKYTSIDGTRALRSAIREKFARDNGLDYPEEQIVVGSGAKPLLFNALQAMLDPGDEVVIPTPCWPSHVGAVRLAGGIPVFAETGLDDGFKLTPEKLEAALGPRTACLILCSPSNPTGAGYSTEDLRGLAKVLLEHPDVWIISDDPYEHIVFDDFDFATIAAVEPRLYERTLTVNGVSKCYAMTGWRIGYCGGPKRLIDGIIGIVSQAQGNACSISQAAAVEALGGPQDFLADWAADYRLRRDLAITGLAEAPGLRCAVPQGAFYLYPWCGGVIGKTTPAGLRIDTSADFARYLLEDWNVVVVPGLAFEADPYFRMTFAVGDDVIEQGVAAIAEACRALT